LKYAVKKVGEIFGPIFDYVFWRVNTDIRINTHTSSVPAPQRTQSVPLAICLGHDTNLFYFI
jgi:hypothetical protein